MFSSVNVGLGFGLVHHFGSGSVQFFMGRVWFGFLHIFTLGFGLVLGKTWVLVRFVLTGFGFFPISARFPVLPHYSHCYGFRNSI